MTAGESQPQAAVAVLPVRDRVRSCLQKRENAEHLLTLLVIMVIEIYGILPISKEVYGITLVIMLGMRTAAMILFYEEIKGDLP